MNCFHCSHYHDNVDQLLCDKGLFDIRISGKPTITVTKPLCIEYNAAETKTIAVCNSNKEQVLRVSESVIDKRSKAYRDSQK